jgi:DNA-binding NtrC family response regulator
MKKLRILIVEDDVVTRMALENLLTQVAPVAIIARRSVDGAREVLRERFDFAFLDVNVSDGETFGLASALLAKRVPFAFMTDRPFNNVPKAWRSYPALLKPLRRSAVQQVLLRAEEDRLVA